MENGEWMKDRKSKMENAKWKMDEKLKMFSECFQNAFKRLSAHMLFILRKKLKFSLQRGFNCFMYLGVVKMDLLSLRSPLESKESLETVGAASVRMAK